MAALKAVTTTKALTTAPVPIYERFCKKKNQDKLLKTFNGLTFRLEELLMCDNHRIANLVLIQLPGFLVGFCKSSTLMKTKDDTTKKIQPAERGPLVYIAGHIVSKLIHKNRAKRGETSGEIQAPLQVMKSTEASNTFISARKRSGLICPCDDLINIVEVAESSFREEIKKVEGILKGNGNKNLVCLIRKIF